MAITLALHPAPGLFIGWMALLGLLIAEMAHAGPAGNASALQEYRYALNRGKEHAVCRHMVAVYNDNFRQPWHYDTYNFRPPWFPSALAEPQEPQVRFGLSSRFPASEEFDAVPWKESLMSGSPTSTVLVGEFDIDNDGKKDLVLKIPQMDPWRDGAEDALVVLDPGQLDIGKPIARRDVYFLPDGLPRPALINYMTLGFMGAWIRPFIYEGTTYLSVHQSGSKPSIWILKYKGGGGKIGSAPPDAQESDRKRLARPWKPVDVDRLCQLRMIPAN